VIAPLTLEQIAALVAKVPALEIKVAQLEARLADHQDPDLNRLLDVKVAVAEANTRGACTTTEAVYKAIAREQIKKYPVNGSTRRYRVRLGDLLGGAQ
jgi:hypothetical protein